MITYFIIKMHCKYRIYNASLQRACGAPTTHSRPYSAATKSPQRAVQHAVQTPSRGFVLSMFKNTILQRLHSVADDCTARTTAICNFSNAV